MPARDKYTDPELRDQVKDEIHEGGKGGEPGQWSARKAQMMASEYKKRGGGYTTDKKGQDDSQKHLDKWTEEEWQTKEGSGNARQEDGTEKRYLPKKAWEKMSEEEKEKTDKKKLSESKEGKQYVSNTSDAKQSRKEANEEEDEEYENREEEDEDEEEDENEDDETEEQEDQQDDDDADGEDSKPKAGQKRKKGSKSNQAGKQSKASKTSPKKDGVENGKKDSGSDERKGSKDRLPKKGQEVEWHSLPGMVKGTVVEVSYENKEVDGKQVKASADDPRIVLKSSSSGKTAVHKPEAVFFD